MKHKALIVDADKRYVNHLRPYFVHADMECYSLQHGSVVREWLVDNPVDIILFDPALADIDGITLCTELSQMTSMGIIMLSAENSESKRLQGLEAGADDYLEKFCNPREIVIRCKVLLRRLLPAAIELCKDLALSLNDDCYSVTFQDEELALTSVEYHLVKQLFRAYGRTVSREKLLEGMYQDNRVVSQRTIDSHIKNIRKKLKVLYPEKEFIRSVYGMGYKMEIEPVQMLSMVK